ncbi:6948_t:CDS:2 [Acaulospora morrowiae]|uniref:6948_t:CDS:1 n=1 Tax=Acaulospora morrowiae TaxID=94023 RepID=A0A9N8VJ02_9GLOM|nr:6948_t:CDS:2 [Acaulospora morrowiae]
MAFIVLPGILIAEKVAEKVVIATTVAAVAVVTKVAVEVVGAIAVNIYNASNSSGDSNSSDDSNKRNEESIGDGKPTEEDGFVPKRNWDGTKTVAKNGKRGYEDKKGDIWVPVKKSNHEGAHRGEHWDVQHRDGTYHNTLKGQISPGNRSSRRTSVDSRRSHRRSASPLLPRDAINTNTNNPGIENPEQNTDHAGFVETSSLQPPPPYSQSEDVVTSGVTDEAQNNNIYSKVNQGNVVSNHEDVSGNMPLSQNNSDVSMYDVDSQSLE